MRRAAAQRDCPRRIALGPATRLAQQQPADYASDNGRQACMVRFLMDAIFNLSVDVPRTQSLAQLADRIRHPIFRGDPRDCMLRAGDFWADHVRCGRGWCLAVFQTLDRVNVFLGARGLVEMPFTPFMMERHSDNRDKQPNAGQSDETGQHRLHSGLLESPCRQPSQPHQ